MVEKKPLKTDIESMKDVLKNKQVLILDSRSDTFNDDLDYFIEVMNRISTRWIFEGEADTWRGKMPYERSFPNPEEFFNKLFDSNLDSFTLELNKTGRVKGEGYHHDGVNEYELIPIDKLNKEDLLYYFTDEFFEGDKKLLEEESKKWIINKPINEMTREDIRDIFYDYIYDYRLQ